MPELRVISLAEQPDLAGRIWELGSDWPSFVVNDPVAVTAYLPAIDLFPDLHLVRPDHRGKGLSTKLLQATCDKFRALGTADLVAPVRPNGKANEPRTPIDEYVARTRQDGLPSDHWLRVHVRLGGRILKVARRSMSVRGTLQQWRAWTQLPFDQDGLVDVPGALAPVLVDTKQQRAVYVEPNVWVHHQL